MTPNPDDLDLLARVSDAERILDALIDLPPDERRRRAQEICERDPDLRTFIEPFLAGADADAEADADADGDADGDPGTVLPIPPLPIIPLDTIAQELAAAPPLPERVGPYRILSELGRGGMGRVLLAVREGDTPTPQVALKLLDTSRHSREELDRFARERETLSRLQHPHIARLYDSGVTAEGLPYLVMELVEGAPIDRHCDAKGLGIEARLQLFRQICTAVEYAHSRLVIHRDLKPANVLVDVHGQVKLLDFGIAKWLEELDRDAPLMTRTSHRVLTPAHAAPEQFRGEPITAATDVYQLGLLLYQMLTGQRAHGQSDSSPSALERAALETDPERPSRVAVPGAARRLLSGDLDAIVMKALRKEPAARYPTVEALRRDLDDYLAFRPVSARRGSRRYTLGKYVRRNRAAVAAAAGILITSLVGVTGIILQMRATAQERDRVRSAEARASAINTFLVNELLTGSTPEKRQGRDLTLADVLGNAARGIEHTFRNQPETEADLRLTLARTYAAIGRPADARAHADAALRILARTADSGSAGPGSTGLGSTGLGGAGLGASAPEALRVRSFLASLAIEEGKFKEARQELERILERQRVQPGPAHQDTLRTQALLARSINAQAAPAAAENLLREAVAAADRHHPGDWRLAVEIRTALVEVLMTQTKGIEAEAVSREMLALQRKHLGPAHPDVLAAHNLLARTLTTLLKNDEALKVHAEAVRLHEQVYGPDHPSTADAQADAAIVYGRLALYKDSFTLFERAYNTYRQRLGPEHPAAIQTLGNIGILYRRFGDDVKAEAVYREVYEVQRRTRGETHPRAIRAGRNLNMLLVDTGRLDEARRVARDLVRVYETIVARPDTDAVTLDDYAILLLEVEPEDVRNPARALEIATRAVAASGRKHYLRLKTLAQAHAALGQPRPAIAVAREALALPGAIQSWSTEEMLVELLQKHGTAAEIETFLLHRLEEYPRLGRANDRFPAKTLRHLARLYARQGRAAEAEQRYREVLDRLRKIAPDTDWEVGRAKSELGAQLAARRAFAEAEPLLVSGFEALIGDSAVREETTSAARARIVTLYEDWKRPDDARRWRTRALH